MWLLLFCRKQLGLLPLSQLLCRFHLGLSLRLRLPFRVAHRLHPTLQLLTLILLGSLELPLSLAFVASVDLLRLIFARVLFRLLEE